MNNRIKLIVIILALVLSGIFLFLGFTNIKEIEAVNLPVKLGSYLDSNEFCKKNISETCITTQELRGQLQNNELTIADEKFIIEQKDTNNPESTVGQISGTEILVTLYTQQEFEGETGYAQTKISSLTQEGINLCVDAKYYYFKVIPNNTKIENLEFNNGTGYLEIFPCIDDEQEKEYIFKKLELELLD